MPGIVDVAGVEVFGKGRGRYPLPCGYVDGRGNAHRYVTLRELSGEEEDLMDDDEIPVTERMSRVLAACTEKIGSIENKEEITQAISDTLTQPGALPLTSSDRIAMMIYLRRVSVGDAYRFERRCPSCGFMNTKKQLDLRTIKIDQVPEDRVNKRRVEVTLPRSRRKAIVAVLSAKREAKLTDLDLNQKDLKSAAILARLEAIEVEEAIGQLGRLVPANTPEVGADGTTGTTPTAVTPTPGAPPASETPGSADGDMTWQGEGEKPKSGPVMKRLDADMREGLEIVRALPIMDRNYLRKVYERMEIEVDTKVEVKCDGKLCGVTFSFPLDLGQAFFLNPAEVLSSDEDLNWL